MFGYIKQNHGHKPVERFSRGRNESSSPSKMPAALQLQQKAGNRAVQKLLQFEMDREGRQEMAGQVDPAETDAESVANSITQNDTDRSVVRAKRIEESAIGGIEARVQTSELLRSFGESMDEPTRRDMENRFGHPFSDVRIHRDSAAHESAASLNAAAFTTGPHVVFGGGRYAPHTAEGKHLLAHELAHVIQQRDRQPSDRRIQRAPALQLQLPRQQLRAMGNPDITMLVDALPGVLMNGQRVQVLQVTEGEVTHTFTLTITITPGSPPVTSSATAGASEAVTKSGGSTGPQTWVHNVTVGIFQQIPDPVRTLFHELVHVRLLIDRYLSASRQTATFKRYDKSLKIAKNTMLPERQAVLEKIAEIRKWYVTFVPKFSVPPDLAAGDGDQRFYEFLMNEKFANQEANAAITNEIVARRYSNSIQVTFAMAVDGQGRHAERIAAESRARGSISLPSPDDLVSNLARVVTALYTTVDKLGSVKEILPDVPEYYPLPPMITEPGH